MSGGFGQETATRDCPYVAGSDPGAREGAGRDAHRCRPPRTRGLRTLMPQYIVKPERDRDFYVYWDTVTDSPWAWGDRATLEREMAHRDVSPARFARADETGTSSFDGFFDFEDDEFIVYNLGDEPFVVERSNLVAWCSSIRGDGGPGTTWDSTLTKLLVWDDDESDAERQDLTSK